MWSTANREPRRGVGKVVLIGCGAAIVLLIGIVVLVVALTAGQVKIVETHLAAMRSKDLDGAFKEVDGKSYSKEQLTSLLEHHPQIFGSSDVSFPSRKVETVNGVERAEIVAAIKGTDGKDYRIQYVLRKAGEDWKIAEINSEDLSVPVDLAIKDVEVSQNKLQDGRTEVVIDCVVVGCSTRKHAAKFEYDVVLKGKLEDAAGTVLLPEQEMKHVKDINQEDGQPVTGKYTYTIPPGIDEVKASILIEDVVSGKGVSQVVPVKIEK